MDQTTTPTADEADSSAPFISVFDTPPDDTPTPPVTPTPQDPPSTDTPTMFDPQQLVAEFKAKATAEREEQERIERELQAKLVELTQLKRLQREQYDQLAALDTAETDARQFPERLSRLATMVDRLEPATAGLKERGFSYEQQQQRHEQTISELEQFLRDTTAARDTMVAEFGGGEIGEQRYLEVEQRTQRALEQQQTTLTRTQELYQAWKREVIEAFQEPAKEVGMVVDAGSLQSSELDLLADGLATRRKSLEELGGKTASIITALDSVGHQIDKLLADKRIDERLAAEEIAITAAHQSFTDCVLLLHGIAEREPTELLLKRLANTFFDIVFESVMTSEQRPQTASTTATALSKSLTSALQKMKQQPTIDFVRLTAHIKAQLAMQQTKRPALLQATRGYNDLLSFSLLIGLIGSPRQAFEPFAIEHAALGGQADQLQSYMTQRLAPFHKLFELITAAHDARERVANLQSPEPWPSWLKDAIETFKTSGIDKHIDQSTGEYKELVAELASALSKYIAGQQKHAEQDVAQARQRLLELAGTHRDLTSNYEHSQTNLKESLSALSLVDDSMELVNELERLIGQQRQFGLLPLARGNNKNHEEVEQRSKLLLLKLPDLRRAAELISLDLGQVDVTDPSKLKPQFDSFKAKLEQLVQEQRNEQAKQLEALGSLVELFDQVILGDKTFDQSMRSPWLPKALGEELFAQYRTVEQSYRQTIQNYNLRRSTTESTR